MTLHRWHWSLKLLIALALIALCSWIIWETGAIIGLSITIPVGLAWGYFFGYHNLALAIFGGALTGLAWPASGDLTPLLFVSWVPLLLAEQRISDSKRKRSGYQVFGAAYLFFLTFGAVSTWWIYYASGTGLLMALGLNSFFMAMVFRFYHGAKRTLGDRAGFISLIIFWLGFEHLHLFWDFSYPWLNLGNGFAATPSWVQWYEVTGVAGGSMWILAVNLIIFYIVYNRFVKKESWQSFKGYFIALAALIIVPLTISLIRFYTYEEKGEAAEIVAVQPNIDPYGAKFTGDPKEHLERMLALADGALSPETDVIIFPETALQESSSLYFDGSDPELLGLWESIIDESYSAKRLQVWLADHRDVGLLTGMSSNKMYYPGEVFPETARPLGETHAYDAFNASMYVQAGKPAEIYYKSKLLIGVERMPLTWLLKPIEDVIWDMGGTTGSLGSQENRSVFTHERTGLKMAPVICYESVYGEFVGDYIKEGANVITIITNDGWWDDTPGYHQHSMYGALRAIEHRKSIARSANTGISCFIDQKGVISQPTEWWVPDAIRGTVHMNEDRTFYTEYGDVLGRMSLFTAIFIWLWTFVSRIRARFDPMKR